MAQKANKRKSLNVGDIVTLLTEHEAATRPDATEQRSRVRSRSRSSGRPVRRKAQTPTDQLRTRLSRIKGWARIHNLIIEPWVPLREGRSIDAVLRELGKLHPDMYMHRVSRDQCMVLYDGAWHRIMRLEERVCVRRLRGAWGKAKPGYMPCDCCFFRTDSRSLIPVAVGTTNATVQTFHVCQDCLNEGAMGRTSAAGFVVRKLE